MSAALRVTPTNGVVQPWVSVGGGAVVSGRLVQLGLEAGVGLDVRLTRGLLLGAAVRYTQVIDASADDARMVQVGLGLTVRFPSPP